MLFLHQILFPVYSFCGFVCFILFYHCYFCRHLFSNERKRNGVDFGGLGGGEDLRNVVRRESIIRIHCIKLFSIKNKIIMVKHNVILLKKNTHQ